MAGRLPHVRDGVLDLSAQPGQGGIVLGSPGWFAWLDDPATRSFTFGDARGSFTARKERRQRGSQYWVAYRKAGGKLRNAYLGKAADLTLERLQNAAAALAASPVPPGRPVASDLGAAFAPAQRSSQDEAIASPATDRSAPPNNLPIPLTSFIGREQELEALRELIGRPAVGVRLLTLTGPGGTGKTRLGLEAAKCLLREEPDLFPDGIFFVPLSAIDDPNFVVMAIAQTLGVRASGSHGLVESLRDFVRARQILLVLDNFEQVAEAAPLVAALVAVAPGLRVLITSRVLLQLYGEHEYPVPPLPIPNPKHLPPAAELMQCAAVALFAARARAVNLGFTLTEENAAAVAAICVQLDGLPLAIELAAARSKLFAPTALLARLDRRLAFLTGQTRDLTARQQTLRATIDWSYDLLSEAEQTLFARLAVFAGVFTLEAAEAICAEFGLGIGAGSIQNVLDTCVSLVNQSMVRQLSAAGPDGEPRFRLLLTLREYAWERLAERGETEAVQRRHADFFLSLAEQAEPELRGPQQLAWLERLEGEHDNFRTALVWTLARQDAETALRLSGALWRFWELHSHLSEGRTWLMRALQKAEGRSARPEPFAEFTFARSERLKGKIREGMKDESAADSSASSFQQARAKVLHGAGKLANDQGDTAVGQALCEESLVLLRELGDERGSVMVGNSLGIIAQSQRDYDRAAALHETSLVSARRLEDRVGAYVALYNLAELARAQGDYQRAVVLHEESLALKRAQGDLWSIAWSLVSLGQLAELHGDQTRAAALYRESLTLRWPLRDTLSLAESLTGLAGVAAVTQQPERAARLCGAVESLLGTIGASLSSLMLAYYDRTVAIARTQLDAAAFAAAWAAGRALSLDQVVAWALEREPAAASDRSSVPDHAMPVSAPAAGTGSAATSPPAAALIANLLATKLYVPPVRPNLVPRPRLTERLNAGLTGKLTLITAPVGFGKTTLLAAWLAEGQKAKGKRQNSEANDSDDLLPFTFSLLPFNVAWVSLDAGDNDPTRFWIYFIAALHTLVPGAGAAALVLLQSSHPPPIESILTILVNAISAAPPGPDGWRQNVLVLDDYHVVTAPAIHQALATLIDYLPPHLHLVIASRADPPLPLPRWRARGALTELRAAALRFTPEEAATFLTNVMGLPLAAAEVAALEARTEGWIAGLHLAALAMRDRADRAGFISAFTGSNRFVVDYLAAEVFECQPPHLQAFLLQTSILDRMCGQLCDAVMLGELPDTHQAYSQALLEELERSNVFTIALDDERRWYRYHHLFAEVMRQRLLQGAAAEAVEILHCRASAWYERQGLGAEAVQHALAAHDWERAARLIEELASPTAHRGQIQTVLGWLTALPEWLMRSRPMLSIYQAAMLMYTNRLADADAILQDAEQALDGLQSASEHGELVNILRGRLLQVRATIRRYSGDIVRCVTLARQVLELLPETQPSWRAVATLHLAHAFLVSGDVSPAQEEQAQQTIVLVRATGNLGATVSSITNLAQLQVLQGRLRTAAATYNSAVSVAPEADGPQVLVGSAAYYIGMGDLHRERNELAEAEHYLEIGLNMVTGELTVEAVHVTDGYIALAGLLLARGDHTGALRAMETFANIARQRGITPVLTARGAAVLARVALAQGNMPAALRWVESRGLSADDGLSYPHEREYLTLGRVLIAQGRNDPTSRSIHSALHLLNRLLDHAEAGMRMSSVIEILILRALALHTQGNTTGALIALERALALAEPEDYVRIFVDEGARLAILLQEAHVRGIAPDYTTKLLAAFPATESSGLRTESQVPANSALNPQSSALVEPLTARELEVLHLVAAGLSDREIAARLVVAIGTVKRHLNNLYGKLGVRSRTQALVRARDHDLL
jgi:LuxR family transcriptional regulator, maltose regulon positive regulatory protein